MKIEGGKEIDEALGALEKKVARKYLRKALREGAKPILDQAKADAPELTGLLKKSIKISAGKMKNGVMKAIVGLNKKWFTGRTYYAAWQEFGHFIGKRTAA